MSTAQCMREKTGTWSQIFPNEQVTQQQSALFIKKLLAVAVSNITYLRNIFPEGAYGDRCLEDLNLKILKDDSASSGACQVIKWVKGCFDALDKKYLRMLVMGIYKDPDDPETVIESYTFKFSYAESGGIDIYRNKSKISSAHSTAETKKATMRLLRTIVVLTQSLHSLPDDVFMTMKLWYYDEITPTDYEPPGFQAADSENFDFADEPMNIKVGDVITPFHTVKLRIKTDAKQFEMPEDAVEEDMAEESVSQQQEVSGPGLDEEEELMEEDPEGSVPPSRPRVDDYQVVPEPQVADAVPDASPMKPGSDGQAVSTTGSQLMTPSQETAGVRCGCGYNEDDGLMILCAKCKCWQHGVCYKILDENQAPQRHICDICTKPNDPELQPTEPLLQHMTTIAKEATCLWRRALIVCRETERIAVPALARRLGVEQTVAHGLISRLDKEGFLKSVKNKKHGKPVDKEKLETGIKKYFVQTKINGQDDDNQNEEDSAESQINSEIENITSKAEDMNLTGKSKEMKKNKKNILETLNKIKESEVPPVPLPQGNSRVRGKKRSKLTSVEDYDFEVSNSQDLSQDQDQTSGKRRKASITRKKVKT